MNADEQPTPIGHRLFTPGTWLLIVIMAIGLVFGVYRFFFGLAASTNLSQQYPWGIWIVADVSFIALAAGGFTTAAIAHIFHRHRYHALARPALVTALLGYTFACVALAADLGRYYNIWHPILPGMWQGNSALFEVGMCVMCYIMVLYAEFIPVVCQRFMDDKRYPNLGRWCTVVNRTASRVMAVLIVLGVGISCLHQSSLGHVMVLAPSKLHPLWWSPILALLFLLSAITAGFPTVIFACLYSSWALKLRPPMRTVGGLAAYVPFLLMIYLGFKIGDMLMRRSYVHLSEGGVEVTMFSVEMIFGLIVPLIMFLSSRVRRSPRWLATACLLVMVGVIVNRANVYWIGYHPAFATTRYFPSLAEWGLTIGAVAAILFIWRLMAICLPVVTPAGHDEAVVKQTPGWSRVPQADTVRRAGVTVVVVLALGLGASACAALQTESASGKPPQDSSVPAGAPASDCRACHVCYAPTSQDPCLRGCSRPDRTKLASDRGPDVVILRELEGGLSARPF